MRKVYLFCSAGMSTSMLAQRMQAVADEHEIPIRVNAFSVKQVDDICESDRPDVMLIGPQARFMYDSIHERHPDIPCAAIDQDDYGSLNGERVLRQAIYLLKHEGQGRKA